MTLSSIRPSILTMTPSESIALTMAARVVVIKPKLPRITGAKTARRTTKKPKTPDLSAMSKEQLELLLQTLEQK